MCLVQLNNAVIILLEVELMNKIALDAADIRILTAIQQRGHLSKSRLAELVNLSETPCWARLSKLQKAGLIRGYSADITLELVCDLTKVIVTLSLTKHRKSDFERFETHICSLDEVVECIATGGGTDYVMKVMTPTLTAFQNLMEDLLSADLGIDRYMTYIVTREIKSSQPNLANLTPARD
jgi:Lrp/AsnC family transcriptional regulator of ectoine degradation